MLSRALCSWQGHCFWLKESDVLPVLCDLMKPKLVARKMIPQNVVPVSILDMYLERKRSFRIKWVHYIAYSLYLNTVDLNTHTHTQLCLSPDQRKLYKNKEGHVATFFQLCKENGLADPTQEEFCKHPNIPQTSTV